MNARPLRAAASPRSTAESAAKCCRAPQRREALPGAAWIHGYMWILTNVQYCGYCNTWIPRYCVYHRIAHTCTGPVLRIPDTVLRIPRIHTHPRAVHVHAYSRTQHTTASPHLTHSSSSTSNLLDALQKVPCPAPLHSPISGMPAQAASSPKHLHITRSQLDSA